MSPSAAFVILAVAVGACAGSFFNVLIHRMPRDESIVRPRSRCPACGTPIRPIDNVPILSYALLGGACRACGAAISLRYPAVEALAAVAYGALAVVDGPGVAFLKDIVFVSLFIPIAFIDIDHRIIPDELSLGGLAAGLLASLLPGGDWKGSVAGGVLGGGLLYVTAWGYERITGREGMGGGDVKLIAMIGAFLGWRGALLTIFGASVLGVAGGLLAMRKGEEGLKTAIPFGPYLCAAALVARFGGGPFWALIGI